MKKNLPPNVLDAVSDYATALDSVRAQLKAEQKLNAAGYSESDIDQLYYEIQ